MERSELGDTDVGQRAARRCVHHVSIQQLNLDFHSIVDQRVDLVFQFRRRRKDSPLLLYPVPTGAIRTVFVLSDSDPLESGIKHARPPPAIPRQVGFAGQIGVDPKSILHLRRTFVWYMIGDLSMFLGEAGGVEYIGRLCWTGSKGDGIGKYALGMAFLLLANRTAEHPQFCLLYYVISPEAAAPTESIVRRHLQGHRVTAARFQCE